YQAHGHHVLRRARRLLASDAEAHDVLQEIFLSLLQAPEQFDQRSSITTWLYSATTHLCLNRIRNRKNRERRLATEGPSLGVSNRAAEASVIAADLLASLPDEQAQAAVYYFIDESSHAEIALLMGCSRRHVGDLLARVRQRWSETGRRASEAC